MMKLYENKHQSSAKSTCCDCGFHPPPPFHLSTSSTAHFHPLTSNCTQSFSHLAVETHGIADSSSSYTEKEHPSAKVEAWQEVEERGALISGGDGSQTAWKLI